MEVNWDAVEETCTKLTPTLLTKEYLLKLTIHTLEREEPVMIPSPPTSQTLELAMLKRVTLIP